MAKEKTASPNTPWYAGLDTGEEMDQIDICLRTKGHPKGRGIEDLFFESKIIRHSLKV